MARKRRKGGKGKAAQRPGAASEVRSKQAADRAGAASEARSKRAAERSDRDRAVEIEKGAEHADAAADSTTAETERPPAGPPSMRAVLHAFAWVGVVIILGLGGIVLLSVLPQLE